MLDGDCLVVVEVKMRQGEAAGRAEQAVSAAQARRLLNAGEHFVAEHPEYADLFWRCDLVAITLQPNGEHSIRHLVNAIVTG